MDIQHKCATQPQLRPHRVLEENSVIRTEIAFYQLRTTTKPQRSFQVTLWRHKNMNWAAAASLSYTGGCWGDRNDIMLNKKIIHSEACTHTLLPEFKKAFLFRCRILKRWWIGFASFNKAKDSSIKANFDC